MKLKHFLEFSRLEHTVMVIIAVLLGEFLTIGFKVPFMPTLLTCISAAFISIGAFIYSDYCNIGIDKIKQKAKRPLSKGEVSPREAWVAAVALFALGLIFAYFVKESVFVLAFIFVILSALYAYSLKAVPILGDMIIALGLNIPFIFGNLAVSEFVKMPVLVIAISGFLFGMSREVIKGIEDAYYNKKTGKVVLPMIVGIKTSEWIASITAFAAMALQIYLFFKVPPFLNSWQFLLPAVIGDFFVAYALHELIINRESDYKQIRNLILIAPFFTMLGIFLTLVF